MRIFGGDRISQLMTMFNLPEDTPLSHSMVSKAIEQSQIKVEGHNFDMRKHLVEYDDVINKQRDIVYAERRKILKMPEEDKKKFEDTIFDSIEDVIKSMATSYFTLAENLSEEERENIIKDFNIMLSVQESRIEDYLEEEDQEKFELFLLNEAKKKFNSRKEQVTDDVWFSVVRSIYLSVYDKFWTQHLTAIADLREGINLRGYAHLNPLNEYKNEAYTMFEKLLNDIHYEAVRKIMRVQVDSAENLVEKKEDKKQDMVFKSASSTDPYSSGEKDYSQQTGSTSQSVGRQKKLGRNDLCWCGSGKKYKKCHYPN
jgi:preprotein translocase subunit SecA